MKCPKCGNELVDINSPCSTCGKKMTAREIKIEKMLARKSKESSKVKNRFFYDVGNSYQNFWIKIFDIKSLTSPMQFWYPVIINLLVIFASCFITYWIGIVLIALTTIPTITCAIRRIKDGGREWFYFMLLLLPGAGIVVLIVLLSLPSYYQTIDEARPAKKPMKRK